MAGNYLEEVRGRIRKLEEECAEILKARDAAYAGHLDAETRAETAFNNARTEIEGGLETGVHDIETGMSSDRTRIEEAGKRNTARVERAYANIKTALEESLRADLASCAEALRGVKTAAAEEHASRSQSVRRKYADMSTRLDALHTQVSDLNSVVETFARRCKARTDVSKEARHPQGAVGDFEAAVNNLSRRLKEAGDAFLTMRRTTGLRMVMKATPFGAYAAIFIAHALAGFLAVRFAPEVLYFTCIGGSFVVLTAVTRLIISSLRSRAAEAAMSILEKIRDVSGAVEQRTDSLSATRENELRDLEDARMGKILVADEEITAEAQTRKGVDANERAKLRRRYEKLKKRAAGEQLTGMDDFQGSLRAKKEDFRKRREQDLERLHEERTTQKERAERDRDAQLEELAKRWRGALDAFTAYGREAMARRRERHPSWDHPSWQELTLPTAFPDEVDVGAICVDLNAIELPSHQDKVFSLPEDGVVTLPMLLSFPSNGSLLISTATRGRTAALEALFGATLKVLGTFPPGMAKLTVIDPVGLGQNFSALMDLADHDESLVSGRIWSESTHIERRLSELTEHIEKVIQKYLRNRYDTIDDYNREAGEMTEPYHFLVVADFPAGFSELAVERLASILTSGVRCGVYALMLHDSTQKLPAAVDFSRFKQTGPVIAQRGDFFVVDDPDLKHAMFQAAALPDAALTGRLLAAIGEQCVEGTRVEVPFEAAVPPPDDFWSSSSQQGIRIPLGKAGADRLQYLSLGEGTLQHALIAGKTGSGKSTLFHVIITNAALWFPPNEIEFYLIDFKKGVEFKSYAVHGLPHARVIAIESDREFGLSVLKRIDAELTRRGELFREARVQDVAAYRAGEHAEHMPRTLLIIDEFQEFFTEDDGVAQEAALLLDRIVRQGRAFGVHVILGSQTLGGAYTLARSTIGQMAVRIALQCSEADSYLILSDDNSAARLLARPGEAIYNDMSGLIEGNNPFQIVWLPDGVKESYLQTIRERVEKEGARPENPTVVFEGNVPADIERNALLARLAANGPGPDDPRERVWVGEPNAIKGPTEARFYRQSGGNLMIAGQRADAAFGMFHSSIRSLTASHDPDDLRIVVLDGSTPETGHGSALEKLAASSAHDVRIVSYRDTEKAVAELDREVRAREGRESAEESSVYLMVLGLQRFRMLRQGDDYDFGDADADEPSPDRCFGNILMEGPPQGVHSIVWCDSLANINRTLSRKTQREFEMRILFQMSSGDSAELIDSPVAANLGLYNAVLFVERDGTLEKFRPYAPPPGVSPRNNT